MLATLSCPWREEEKKKSQKMRIQRLQSTSGGIEGPCCVQGKLGKIRFFFGLRGLRLLCQKDSRVFGTHKSVKQIVKM